MDLQGAHGHAPIGTTAKRQSSYKGRYFVVVAAVCLQVNGPETETESRMAEMCGLLLCPRRRRIQRSLSAVVRTLALNAADGRAGGRTRGRR